MLQLPGVARKSTASVEGLSDGASPLSDASGPMKVTVKNTFIEMMPEKAEDRVAQSCTARLSDPSPHLFTPDPTPKSSTTSGGNRFPVQEYTSDTKSHASGSSGSRDWTTSVKNTFIEIHDDLESPIAADRMALSCTARLSAPNPTFQLDGIAEEGRSSAQIDDPPSQLRTNQFPVAPPGCALPPYDYPEEFKMTVKNTFIDFKRELPVGHDPFPGSCMARLSDPVSTFIPPTPVHNETIAEDNAMVFPPIPQTVGGGFSQSSAGYLDMEGLHTKPLLLTKTRSPVQDMDSACPTADARTPTAVVLGSRSPQNPPVPPPLYEAPVDLTNLPDHASPPPLGPPLHAAGLQLPLKGGNVTSSGSRKSAEPSTGEADWPSLGSKLHGTAGDDGNPLCKPCAWFYKEGSCLNAKGCGYCHLCPQGELKNRKKTKIALLRKAEAEAVSSPTAKSVASTSPKSEAGVDKRGKVVFSLQSHLPS